MSSSIENHIPRILCVDDELAVAKSVQRVLKRAGYRVDIETSPMDALNDLMEDSYDVIISDMRMPEMDGAEFFAATEKFSPDSIRILLTGYSDQCSTVRAINEGKVYSYVNKPWDNQEFRNLIDDALAQKALVDKRKSDLLMVKGKSEKLKSKNNSLRSQVDEANENLHQTLSVLDITKEELQQTHKQTVRVFAELLGTHYALPQTLTSSMTTHLKNMSSILGLNASIEHDIENAAVLYHLGDMTLPDTIKGKVRHELNEEQREQLESMPARAEELLLPLVSMHGVGKLLKSSRENYDGSGYPNKKAEEKIPLAARLLRIVVDFFEKLQSHPDDGTIACKHLIANAGSLYDPEIVTSFVDYFIENQKVKPTFTHELVEVSDMVLGGYVCQDLYDSCGTLLLAEGTKISHHLIKSLSEYEINREVKLYISISNAEPTETQ